MGNAKGKPPKGWSYSVGERGRNRVRAFAHPVTGRMFVEFYEPARGAGRPRPKRMALGHRDTEQAKATAEELAARLRRAEYPATEHVTLATLFDMYLKEVTPSKGAAKQRHDRACAELFLHAFGGATEARALSRREWDRYIRDRRSGALSHARVKKRRAVGDCIIAYDLAWLMAVLNWATKASNERGVPLLDRNPLKGLARPREKNPHREVLSDTEYRAMRAVAAEVQPLFELALVLAHDTGHRMNAIRMLRWSDIDLDRQTIRFQSAHDKSGFEHTVPLVGEAVGLLGRVRAAQRAIGDAWMFPSTRTPGEPVAHATFRKWWRAAEVRAKLAHVPHRGWHSLRRKFASELKHVPLKDLCQLGGWKDASTVLRCYMKPDEATMRAALEQRRPLPVAGSQ